MQNREKSKGFYKLQKLIFKDVLGSDFRESDFEEVRFHVRKEYKALNDHIQSVLDTLKNKNKSIEVSARVLSGAYIIEPKFKKLVQKKYIYRQKSLREFNTLRKAKYKDQELELDEDHCYISDKPLEASDIFPYINLKSVDQNNTFTEEVEYVHAVEKRKLDIASKNGFLFSFYNDLNLDEHEVTIEDIREVFIRSGITNVNLSVQGHMFISDKEIDSEYFRCTLSDRTRLRLFIDSLNDQEHALDDVSYFYEEIEGRFILKYINGTEEEIDVIKRYRDEQILVIEKKNKTEFIKDIKSLVFDISLTNLVRQNKVLKKIIDKPSDVNSNLIKIVTPKATFINNPSYRINEYYFIKDINYQGTLEQRDFVQKALATDDFMILSGPPGTGKTTAIMEFILQAIKKDPKTRILLSASTHVAIDNVLENFIEIFKDKLHDYNLFPIRIGTMGAISSSLDDFSYEKIKESKGDDFAKLYLNAANLVCGTTMGIIKYMNNDIFEPKFDYLIIDEASKTTLQEYIVPASFCKKHIIVGDVNQLSPYTDTFMLETILKSQPNINKEIEELAYFHFVLHVVSRDKKYKRTLIVLPSDNLMHKLPLWYKDNDYQFLLDDNDMLHLFGNMNCVISRNTYLKWISYIPESFQDILTINELPSFIKLKQANKIQSFSDAIENHREEADNLIGGNWAREVAWRYVRFHELKKSDDNFQKELDWLIPEKISKIYDQIEELSDITIPSILLKLQEGVKSRNQNITNRLRSGFTPEDKKTRFVHLKYQHRMHSEISKYAEISIYSNDLMTAKSVDMNRSKLNLFDKHSIFVDVNPKMKCKQENEQEAIEITRIVKLIMDKYKGLVPIKVGILTFYKAQERLIKSYLEDMLKEKGVEHFNGMTIDNITLEIFTVDKFQGKESDISIISLSRNKGLGFMNVPNRINVAMTRAKYYRIVVGAYDHFSRLSQPFIKNIALTASRYPEGELR